MRKICLVSWFVLFLLAYSSAASLPESPAPRNVSGTEILHYRSGPVPVDLSATTIAALVPHGSSYDVISGSGTSSGTFSIANVPSGFYLLQIGNLYLWTNQTVVDADSDPGDRPGEVQADQNTMVTFDLTNLNAWQATDFFEMVCPNNAAIDVFPGTTGETTFTGTYEYFGALSDASQGDQYYLLQLITQSVGGFPFTAVGRYLAPPKFTQAQGSDTPIDGKLKTIPQTQKFEANINGADLTAQTLAANPNAVMIDTTIYLDAHPGSMAHGQGTSTPDLVGYNFGTGQPFITSNGDLGPVSYGNPFPKSKWPLFGGYAYAAVTMYTAPGATQGAYIGSSVQDNTTTLPTAATPMKPLVGVVANPSINGKKFFTNLTGVGFTPLLKWSAPSVGTATFYDVQVFQLSNNNGNTVKTLLANLETPRLSLRVPTGLLTSGSGYVFRIRPVYNPGVNFNKTPRMFGPTTAVADVLSGMMQP